MASTSGGQSSQLRRPFETTLAARSCFNSGSGRKQEREKSWLQAKLEATYSSTSNSEFAVNFLSLENRRR